MKTYQVAILALNNIGAFHLSVPCLVFQDVFIDLTPAFSVKTCSPHPDNINLSSGFSLSVMHDLSAIEAADIVIIPSWPNALPEPDKELLEIINKAYKRGAIIVGLCLGAYVLAKSGILDGKRATTHWGYEKQFKHVFSKVTIDCRPLFIEQDNILTSAGTVASIDCCLHLVRKLCGSEVASHIARTMVAAPFRSGGQQQYIPSPIIKQPNKKVQFNELIASVSQHLHLSYDLNSLASQCAMSRRTFTRQFKAAYGCTFGEWLLNQRLALSQQLLESTEMPIAHIAEQSGIGSESVFRKHFKKQFSVSPSQWRRTFNGLSINEDMAN